MLSENVRVGVCACGCVRACPRQQHPLAALIACVPPILQVTIFTSKSLTCSLTI